MGESEREGPEGTEPRVPAPPAQPGKEGAREYFHRIGAKLERGETPALTDVGSLYQFAKGNCKIFRTECADRHEEALGLLREVVDEVDRDGLSDPFGKVIRKDIVRRARRFLEDPHTTGGE